jgi:hypothetical protein
MPTVYPCNISTLQLRQIPQCVIFYAPIVPTTRYRVIPLRKIVRSSAKRVTHPTQLATSRFFPTTAQSLPQPPQSPDSLSCLLVSIIATTTHQLKHHQTTAPTPRVVELDNLCAWARHESRRRAVERTRHPGLPRGESHAKPETLFFLTHL